MLGEVEACCCRATIEKSSQQSHAFACFLRGAHFGGVLNFQGILGGGSGNDGGARGRHDDNELGGVVMRHNEMVAADMQQDLPAGVGSDIDDVEMVSEEEEVALGDGGILEKLVLFSVLLRCRN